MSSRSENRSLINTKSQERLIGGKKPTLTIMHQPAHQVIQQFNMPQQILHHKPQLQQTYSHPYQMDSRGSQIHAVGTHLYQHPLHQQIVHDTHSLDKQKRNCMKTQATQTDKLDEKAKYALFTNSCSVLKVRILYSVFIRSFIYLLRNIKMNLLNIFCSIRICCNTRWIKT